MGKSFNLCALQLLHFGGIWTKCFLMFYLDLEIYNFVCQYHAWNFILFLLRVMYYVVKQYIKWEENVRICFYAILFINYHSRFGWSKSLYSTSYLFQSFCDLKLKLHLRTLTLSYRLYYLLLIIYDTCNSNLEGDVVLWIYHNYCHLEVATLRIFQENNHFGFDNSDLDNSEFDNSETLKMYSCWLVGFFCLFFK